MVKLDRDAVCNTVYSTEYQQRQAPEGWHNSLRSNTLKEWAVSSAETTLSLKWVKLDLIRVRDVEHQERECPHCHCIRAPQGDALEETQHWSCVTD